MKSGLALRVCVLLLILLSAGLLGWQHFGMNLVLRLDGLAPFNIAAVDDHNSGGDSLTMVDRNGSRLEWDCEIGQAIQYPYCELAFDVAPPPEGFDFSRFDHLAVKIQIEGTGSRRMRLFMRNLEPGFSTMRDPLSFKQNELYFDLPPDGSERIVPLRGLNVASWWITERKIPVERAATDISHVPVVQLSVGGVREERNHRISIEYVEFRGKRMSQGDMARLVTACWLAAALIFLLLDLRQRYQQLADARARQSQLEQVNLALKVENERVESMARRDPLTGLLNRAGVRDMLFTVAVQTAPEKRSLALLCCDIDHFKHVNDSLGHPVGDEVLVQMAHLLQHNVRQTDLVVRWGGEEFFLFCPDTPLEAAALLGEKLRKRVAEHVWPQGLEVTMSVGVAAIGREEALADFIARADAALYDAKQNGRNRVSLAPSPS